MKLSTQTDCAIHTFGQERGIRLLAEAGFDAVDYSFFDMTGDDSPWLREDWRERAVRARETAEACGITINQAHAPFHTSTGEEAYDSMMLERILRSMEAAAIMGARNIIVHPRQHLPYVRYREQLFEENLALYRKLAVYAQEWGIRVCAENMWHSDPRRDVIIDSVCARPEEFCVLLDAVDSPWIAACLDIGHCALVSTDPADAIRALGPKRLQALHVHDVDCIHDNHTLPFVQRLDWKSITAALAEIGYTGDFTLEADNFPNGFPRELRPDVFRLMAQTGRYLVHQIEIQK